MTKSFIRNPAVSEVVLPGVGKVRNQVLTGQQYEKYVPKFLIEVPESQATPLEQTAPSHAPQPLTEPAPMPQPLPEEQRKKPEPLTEVMPLGDPPGPEPLVEGWTDRGFGALPPEAAPDAVSLESKAVSESKGADKAKSKSKGKGA